MKILQRNLNRSTFVVWEMKRNVSVVRLIVATLSSGPPANQPVSRLTRLSADLSVIWLRVPNYFLWAYLKGRVYQNKPRTIDDLKANITEEIQAVTADVLTRIFQNMARRIQSYLDANVDHFQHMVWCYISHTTKVLLFKFRYNIFICFRIINPLNPELNPICYLLALLGAHHFLHVSRIMVKLLNFRLLMSYIYIWSTHSWCF